MSGLLTLEVALVYVTVVVSMALSLLTVFFAYRLSRITGGFGAWSLLMAGLVLLAFEDFAFFGSVIFVSYAKVVSTVAGYTFGSWFIFFLILIAIPILFFASMYKLHAIFKAQVKPKEAAAP